MWLGQRIQAWQYLAVGVNAVVTTGIYCLPSCAGRPSRHNVREYELAAAAEAAGFRACARCRPYRRPATVSSLTVPMLVCRGVQLVVAGLLDEVSEEKLGAILGVSGRHIRRLFIEHLGITPDKLARSTRVHFARRLLDDTELSITEVTFAAGFGSVRQFNRDCKAVFRATPSDLRARRRTSDRLTADGGLALRLPVQSPFDWLAIVSSLAKRAIGGVEYVSTECYRRTVVVDGDPGVVEITPCGDGDLMVRAHLPHWNGLIHVVQRVRRLLNLDADVAGAASHLAGDELIGPIVRRRPGVRALGTWDLFEAGVEAILSRHHDAAKVMTSMALRYGRDVPGLAPLGLDRTFPSPRDILSADLAALHLDQACIRDLESLARAAASGSDGTDPTADNGVAIREAVASRPDVAAALALRMGDPDSFPGTRPEVLRAVSDLAGRPVTPQHAATIAEAWKPWRAHAVAYLCLHSAETA